MFFLIKPHHQIEAFNHVSCLEDTANDKLVYNLGRQTFPDILNLNLTTYEIQLNSILSTDVEIETYAKNPEPEK